MAAAPTISHTSTTTGRPFCSATRSPAAATPTPRTCRGTTPTIRRALIGDPRNDENAIVSQLQGLFLRFHNRTVADNPGLDFPQIQRLVRFHYQYMVLNDFLPRIIHSSVLKALKGTDGPYDRSKLKFFHWKNQPFMPVEFSVAAYRLGHSMIRPGYRLNDTVLLPIFPIDPKIAPGFPEGLTGFRAMNPSLGNRLGPLHRHRYSYLRRHSRAQPEAASVCLSDRYFAGDAALRPAASVAPDPPPSLPQRNLRRAFRLGLPSGQQVAHAHESHSPDGQRHPDRQGHRRSGPRREKYPGRFESVRRELSPVDLYPGGGNAA